MYQGIKITLLVIFICLASACSKKAEKQESSTTSPLTSGTDSSGSATGGSGSLSTTSSSETTTTTTVTGSSSTSNPTLSSLAADLALLKNSLISAIFGIAQGGTGANNIPLARLNLGIGSVITRYGNKELPPNAPLGSTIIMKGMAHGTHYSHQQGTDIQCISYQAAAQDRGNDWSAASGYYPTHISPTQTGDAVDMPSEIPSGRSIACSQMYVPGPTTLIEGSASCPVGWQVIYSGYLLVGHYTHTGASPKSICVSKGSDFDSSFPAQELRSVVYGLTTYSAAPFPGFPNGKYLPCTYCMKN